LHPADFTSASRALILASRSWGIPQVAPMQIDLLKAANPALLRLKPSRRVGEHGDYARYAGPHSRVNALAGADACRAPLRLKPSRRVGEHGGLRALRRTA
jgi:hypothetical protein